MPTTGGVHPRMLGRDSDAAVRHFAGNVRALGVVPPLFRGAPPRKSPENRRFIPRRYCGQERGCCTGEALANDCEILLRMPAARDAASAPLPETDLSALHAYWHGRRYGRERGVDFGDVDGCVGSMVAFAAKTSGVARFAAYPATPESYAAYSDATPPPADAEAEGKLHPVREARVVMTQAECLSLLGAGFPLMVGMDIPEGLTRTDDAGQFSMGGQTVGGHELVWLDYDLDARLVWILNSWANAKWGARENHPDQDRACGGYNNVGVTRLDDWLLWYSDALLQSGRTEVVVVNNVTGWEPKARSFAEAF